MYQVMFFPNGVSAVFRDGEQVNELQVPWMRLFLEHLDALDVDPRDAEITMPNGMRARVFLTDQDEFNWITEEA